MESYKSIRVEILRKKKGFRKHFMIFTGKHLCWALFFNKVAGHQSCNCMKKVTQAHIFSCEYQEIYNNAFFEEHLQAAAFLENVS